MELNNEEPARNCPVISAAENFYESNKTTLVKVKELQKKLLYRFLVITGTGGAGKSSLVDELVRRFLIDFNDKTWQSFLSIRRNVKRAGRC